MAVYKRYLRKALYHRIIQLHLLAARYVFPLGKEVLPLCSPANQSLRSATIQSLPYVN